VLGGAAAIAALQAAAGDPDPEVRYTAWRAMADCGAPPSLASLLAEVDKAGLQPSTRLADLIRRVVADQPRAAEAAALRGAHGPQTRALLVDAIGGAGDYAALPTLIEAAGDPDPDVRAAAVRALGRLQHPISEPAIRAALADDDWPVQLAGAEAAGAAGLAALTPELVALLGHPEWWVRFRAGEALGRLGAAGLLALRKAQAEHDELVRSAAARALAEAVAA
ncbi:HEAT repeat domain-containing protein, partial [Phenylobacterium sp.]|jgi:HEAT repeat protein|uniref:HEAT repeat domain-containing protein n=1 Tax=Phenylobacterium sp. TaxID=1871053 RepID=UPI002E30E842